MLASPNITSSPNVRLPLFRDLSTRRRRIRDSDLSIEPCSHARVLFSRVGARGNFLIAMSTTILRKQGLTHRRPDGGTRVNVISPFGPLNTSPLRSKGPGHRISTIASRNRASRAASSGLFMIGNMRWVSAIARLCAGRPTSQPARISSRPTTKSSASWTRASPLRPFRKRAGRCRHPRRRRLPGKRLCRSHPSKCAGSDPCCTSRTRTGAPRFRGR